MYTCLYIYVIMCMCIYIYVCISLSIDVYIHIYIYITVAFGRPGVRLPERTTSGMQYSCSDQEFRLFVLTTAAPIDREEYITHV